MKKLLATFESDWSATDGANEQETPKEEATPAVSEKVAKKVVAVLAQELRPLTGTVSKAVKKVVAQAGEEVLHDKIVRSTVKKVMKEAVKRAVKEAVQDSEKA